VGFIFCKYQFEGIGVRQFLHIQSELIERDMPRDDRRFAIGFHVGLRFTPLVRAAPRPTVAEPQGRQEMDRGRLGPPVGDSEAYQDVIGEALAYSAKTSK